MAARTLLPKFTTRVTSRLFAPSTTRAFHRSPLARDTVVSSAHVNAEGPGTQDMKPATEVPVISYSDGQRSVEQIQVEKTIVSPPGIDVQSVATALKPELTAKLTPTMKKFTLHNKVAVVTG